MLLALLHRRDVRAAKPSLVVKVAVAVLAIVVGLASIVQVVRIGDSGARAVWSAE